MNKESLKLPFKLLRIQEDEKLLPHLERIFAWVGKLQSLDLSEAYAFYPPGISLRKREDRPENFKGREKLLSSSPDLRDEFFAVPKVL